jgi:hypothetical protein
LDGGAGRGNVRDRTAGAGALRQAIPIRHVRSRRRGSCRCEGVGVVGGSGVVAWGARGERCDVCSGNEGTDVTKRAIGGSLRWLGGGLGGLSGERCWSTVVWLDGMTRDGRRCDFRSGTEQSTAPGNERHWLSTFQGGKRDVGKEKAIRWFCRAAEPCHAISMSNIGA